MREILYRAKAINRDPNRNYRTDYKNGDWVYGLVSRLNEYSAEMTNTDGVSGIDVDRETICEHTGLIDKNGKKVFEGDICRVVYLDRRCSPSYEHYDAENIIIEEVVFEKGTFCFKTMFEDIAMYRPIGFEMYEKQKIKCFEIIGNIYDNPELLEK